MLPCPTRPEPSAQADHASVPEALKISGLAIIWRGGTAPYGRTGSAVVPWKYRAMLHSVHIVGLNFVESGDGIVLVECLRPVGEDGVHRVEVRAPLRGEYLEREGEQTDDRERSVQMGKAQKPDDELTGRVS